MSAGPSVQRPRARVGAAAVVACAMSCAVACAATVAARPAGAQHAEARAEAALGTVPVALVGGGLFVDAGLYARIGVAAAAGVAWRDAASARSFDTRRASGAGEVAVIGRFLLDPLRQARRGVYVGGGVGARASDAPPRYFLLAAVGVEGRPRAGVAPAAELGVGGGVRLAVVLRRTRPDRR